MLIEQLIGDLLLRHNCVVVPAFGGFVARHTSAVLDQRNGVMLPPKKSLLFNRQLINNDGLLIASYAKETGKTYDESAKEIQDQVEAWQKILNAGERITLDKVGYLFLDQEKNIGFEQDRYFNLLLQSYGLGKVHFISEEDIQIVAQPERISIPVENPLVEKQETPVIELIPEGIAPVPAVSEEPKIIPLTTARSSRKIWRYVAAAALMPIAFYSYWIPMETRVLESGVFAFQDFNPFHGKDTGTYESKKLDLKSETNPGKSISLKQEIESLSSDVAVWSYPFDKSLYIPVRIKEHSASVPATAEIESAASVSTSKTGNFHLIANCFGSESNAVKFVEYLKSKGFDAYIVDVSKGLHRVSAGRSNNQSELQDTQKQLDNLQIEGAWILQK